MTWLKTLGKWIWAPIALVVAGAIAVMKMLADARADGAIEGRGEAEKEKIDDIVNRKDPKALRKERLKWLKRKGLVLLIALLASPVAFAQSNPDTDCPPDLVCYTLEEDATTQKALIEMDVQIAKLRRRVSRFRPFGATCGVGPALDIEDSDVTLDGKIACVIGLTIKF